MQSLIWITTSEFAAVSRISERKANQALSRAHSGHSWRGYSLIVITQRGKGGASGLSYLVRIDSLPADLCQQAKLMFGDMDSNHQELTFPGTGTALPIQNPAPTFLPAISTSTLATSSEWQWKLEIIRPAIAFPKGSSGRGEMVRQLASTSFLTPDGSRRQFGLTTIRAWIREYDQRGIAGLCRKGRSDHGESRVVISKIWDSGVPFSDEVKAEVMAKMVTYVKSVWANAGGGKGKGASKNGGGWKICCRLATKELIKLTRDAGLDLPLSKLLELCDVPRGFVDTPELRNYALIHMKNNDAKRYFDTAVPRTRRTREGMVPMELVVGDVHHIDIYLRRDDGSRFTPKMISWLDIATNRIFYNIIFPEKGKSVCQEDIIKSFIEMTQHPQGGMPQSLYLDNGSEYFSMDFINDAMKLARLIQKEDFRIGFTGDDPDVGALAKSARRNMVIKAQPYNAPAKPIEGIFAVLEGGAFAMAQGWIGGKRMEAKTKNVGKEPAVYEGSQEAFLEDFASLIAWYETNIQSGSLKGHSPRSAVTASVNAGWTRTDVDPMALHFAFSTRLSREVTQGEFVYKGIHYRAQKLLELLPGTKIILCIPKVGDKDTLPILDEDGRYLCIAEPAPHYPFLDLEGAKDRGRRMSAQKKSIAEKARDITELDMMKEVREAVALHAPAPLPESGAIIHLSDQAQSIAQAIKQLPATQEQDQDAQYRERIARNAALAKLAAAG